MDDLNYEKHLNHYKSLFGSYVGVENDAEKEAQYSHALAVFDPLSDWVFKSNMIASNLSAEKAKYYLL